MAILVGIADDFTGASDQAGMLAEAGVRSLLVLSEAFEPDPSEWDAITIAGRLRSLPVPEARQVARRLFRQALALKPRMIQYKYCSTFDSTPEGNIGPLLDVGLELTGAAGTVVVPALPVNGRTTYQGNHFVLGVPLSESPMRDHPLNPMTDSNLMRWLGRQTRKTVGLVDFAVVERGVGAVREELEARWAQRQPYVVVDCVSQRQVRTIAAAVADLPFISGSSALAMELPALWRRQGLLGPRRGRAAASGRTGAEVRVLALSGSCAAQTLRQVGAASSFRRVRVNLAALLEGEPEQVAAELLSDVRRAFAAGDRVLLATSQAPAARAAFLRRAESAGLTAREMAGRIERLLARLALLAVQGLGIRRLLVAGGETSGAVCQALDLQAVEILRELAPGVPLCRCLPGRHLVIAVKGGNFGRDDFFATAAAAAQSASIAPRA